MLERLIEYWLDSASERGYQVPFCQMLLAEGHTILHSTRHAPLELGKDIISLNSTKQLCAYQLKGNPSERLSLKQFRDIQPQLVELAELPIVLPGRAKKLADRCYLVTNGELQEEAQRALDDFNAALAVRGFGDNRIEVISRGELLSKAVALGASLWPTEIGDLNQLLEILVLDGNSAFPANKMHALLSELLKLNSDKKIGLSELRRRISSAAVLTGLCLGKFTVAENHFSAICGWLMFISYAISAASKNDAGEKAARNAIHLASESIFESLFLLCEDLKNNPTLFPKRSPDFRDVYLARKTLIAALMSIYFLWSNATRWRSPTHREFLQGWLPRDGRECLIWGEGSIPQLLAHYWYASSTGVSMFDEYQLSSITSQNIHAVRQREPKFPGPYFDYDALLTHQLSTFLGVEDPLREETAAGVSYLSEGLFHLLVRTNLKQTCKVIWPEFTRLVLCEFQPEEAWQYCLWRCERGTERQRIPQPSVSWEELVEVARDCRPPAAPSLLIENKYIFALFLIMCPFRATPSALRYLGSKMSDVWFLAVSPQLG